MPRRMPRNKPSNGASSLPASGRSHRDDGDRKFPPHLLRDRGRHRNLPQSNDASEGVDAAEVVALVPNAVFVARDALSSEECRMWIDHVEEGSLDGWDGVHHPATRSIAHRECGRIRGNDWNTSHRLFRRIEGIVRHISPQLDVVDETAILWKSANVRRRGGGGGGGSSDDAREYRPITCNPNLRLYKYTKGQRFGRHVDESNRIDVPRDQVDGPSFSTVDAREGMRTEITVLFYLSSCRGGATRFHLPRGIGKEEDSSVAFAPEEGAVLLHVHGDRCLEHEAEPVLEGVKYVLRTDIVYGWRKLK
ncbi:hypothetical protein ACHAW5_007530 [Stephanodiscus triporus]|uniref:Fe2OG dioxygenase domain-containing protein n=1 Tax=Stephanodiscus triporus TaxID=2934178 RepID=A0ABD3NRE1_9STRA